MFVLHSDFSTYDSVAPCIFLTNYIHDVPFVDLFCCQNYCGFYLLPDFVHVICME